MTVPPGFFFRAAHLMSESEPADFSSLWLSLFHLFPRFLPGKCSSKSPGAWGPFASFSHSGLPGRPQMDPILGVHWNHPSCPVPLLTERSSLLSMPPPLKPEGVYIFYLRWADGWAGHSHSQILASFLQLMICHTDRATSRKPIAFLLKGNQPQWEKALTNTAIHYYTIYLNHSLLHLSGCW